MAKEKVKKPFNPQYKKYNPEEEGYGDTEQWRSAFNKRMNFEEATIIIGSQRETPYTILGVNSNATWDEIKKAYRAMAMIHHPDKNPGKEKEATETFKKINAAYVVLENLQ